MSGALRRVRVAAGALGLGVWALASAEGWSAMAYLAGLHGGLGRGMLPALCAAWVLLSALPGALSLWAAAPELRRSRQRFGWLLALALAALCCLRAVSSYRAARFTPSGAAVAAVGEPQLLAALHSLQELAPSLPPGPDGSGASLSPALAVCERAPDVAPVSVLVRLPAAAADAAASQRCVQGASFAEVLERVRALVRATAARGAVQLDWVSGVQPLSARHAWIDLLKLRPGLDGACAGSRCLPPGQLLAEGFFSTYRPLGFIPDFQFGVDPGRLRAALGADPGSGLEGLSRIETRSYVVRLDGAEAGVTPLLRLRRRDVNVTRAELARATRAAQGYVLGALLPDGRFRYTLDPLTGAEDTEGFNLARQAGAALVLCELGTPGSDVQTAIERSLAAFRAHERQRPELAALTSDPEAPFARLGESALPLASLVYCYQRLAVSLPPVVGGLARLLLALQRPDGGFWPELELATGEPRRGAEPLYSTGQAVLALVLLEERQLAQPDPALPALPQLHDAVERAMNYFARSYWSHPLAGFFFLEENWHCLAARAALKVHRHAAYEDFCLRYVRFKSRLILEREQGADADFDGGFGFGNLVPPHNTGAAGFAEALAAALSLERWSEQAAADQRRLLLRVLGFLLRQQWQSDNCFACAESAVIGGMSEHTHSLLTRIDFAQHAWAALGHGASVLASELPAH